MSPERVALLNVLFAVAILLVAGCSSSSTTGRTNAGPVGMDESPPAMSDSMQISILESGIDDGPELTNNTTDDAGIHLRRFYAWTSPEQARTALAALSFSDGGDRSALADVLEQNGGTLIGLFAGLQTSSGVVDTSIDSVETNDERLVVTVKTQVEGNCPADAALAAPYRILHVADTAPDVLFREVIQQCVEDDASNTTRISNITVDFLDDATARVDWVQPSGSDDQTRYDVINTEREQEIYDGTNEPSFIISNMVPGIIYSRRIVPIDNNGDVLSQGTSIALMVDAPSGAFRGRAELDDLDKLKISLLGKDVRDCGELTVPYDNDEVASKVAECVSRALEEGVAYAADRVVQGEAFDYDSLVGDGNGNSWLLTQGNSDVNNMNNAFAPGRIFGGYLSGQVCVLPAVLIKSNFGRFTCQ